MLELQRRSKWFKCKSNLKVGDIVLVREKNEKRNCWPLGMIENVKYSSDGIVRSAWVRTTKGNKKVIYRAINDLVLISPADNNVRSC